MNKKTKHFIIGGLIIVLLIGVVSGFIASSDPDGFEKTWKDLVPDVEEEPLIETPMPDYIMPSAGENPISTAIAIIIGIIIVFGLAYCLGYLLKKKNKDKKE